MSILWFELKKRMKQGVILLVVFSALLISLLTVFILPDMEPFSPRLTQQVFLYNPSYFLSLKSETDPTDIYPAWSALTAPYSLEVGDNAAIKEGAVNKLFFSIPSSALYRSIPSFLEQYRFNVTPQAEADLIAATTLYEYFEGLGYDPIYPDISPYRYISGEEATQFPMGAAETLSTRLDLLFGILPFALFFFITFVVITKEYQTNQHQLLWMQPLSRFKLFFIQFLILFLHLLLYISSVLVSVIILNLIQGKGLGMWDMPLPLHGEVNAFLSQFQYIFYGIGLFILKSILFIGAGFLMAMLFKQLDTGLMVSVFIGITGYLLSTLLPAFQHISNPFYNNYELTLLGQRIENTDLDGYPFYAIEQGGTLFYFLFFIIGVIFLVMAYQLRYHQSQRNQRIITRPIHNGLQFELRKFRRLMPIKWLLGGLAAILLVLYLGMILPNTLAQQARIINHQNQIDSNQNYVDSRRAELLELEKNNASASEKEFYINEIEIYEQFIETTKKHINAFEEGESTPFYETEWSMFDETLNPSGMISVLSPYENTMLSPFSVQLARAKTQWSIDHQVKPILLPDVYYSYGTRYDNPTDKVSLEVLQLHNGQPNDASSGMLIYRLFHYYKLHLVLLGVIGLLFGGAYYLEHNHSDGLNLLYTQPKSLGYYYSNKWLASVAIGLLCFVIFIGSLGLLGLQENPGHTWYYPILYHDHLVEDAFMEQDYSDSFHLISLGSWVLQGIALLGSILLCLLSMMHALSSILKNRWLVFIMSFGLSLLGLLMVPTLGPIAPYLPSSYWDIPLVLNGLTQATTNLSITWSWGVLINLLWSLIWFVLGLVLASISHHKPIVNRPSKEKSL